jgi:hypothetical protein
MHTHMHMHMLMHMHMHMQHATCNMQHAQHAHACTAPTGLHIGNRFARRQHGAYVVA